MMSEATPQTTTVRLERLLPAPVGEVFAAWTDPALMADWLAPSGRAEVESDLRVGGRFRVTMIDDDMRIEHTGEYLVIDPPHRLSFTWQSQYTGGVSQVDIVLADRGATTWIVLSHTRLPEQTRSSHRGGWTAMLERLATLLTDDTTATHASTKESL